MTPEIITEHLTASHYAVTEGMPSRIDPSYLRCVERGMRCPNCGHLGPRPGHGCTLICCECGLSATVWGNDLEVSIHSSKIRDRASALAVRVEVVESSKSTKLLVSDTTKQPASEIASDDESGRVVAQAFDVLHKYCLRLTLENEKLRTTRRPETLSRRGLLAVVGAAVLSAALSTFGLWCLLP